MRSIQVDKARVVKVPSGFMVTLIIDNREICTICGDRFTKMSGTKSYALYFGEQQSGWFEAKEIEKVNWE